MITFLWMLYLATTIIISTFTVIIIAECIKASDINKDIGLFLRILVFTSSFLWSVWYFYFLH